MEASTPGPLLQLTEPLRVFRGTAYGLRQPVLLARIAGTEIPEAAQAGLAELLRPILELPAGAPPLAATGLAVALQRKAGLPLFEACHLVAEGPGRPTELAIPYVALEPARLALQCAFALFNRLVPLWGTEAWTGGAIAATGLVRRVEARLASRAPRGSNSQRFLTAAHERAIPWGPLWGNVFWLGQGARSRWLNSSLTDATSRIGAALARDKLAAGRMLREAGLPVPAQRRAGDAEAAVAAAAALGYPVVVKPVDLEQGLGVSVDLRDAEAVRRAFGEAARHSRNILVEQHVPGRDYRLVVLHGRVIWTIERVPAGVTGDGRSSVRDLLEALNRDPRRGTGQASVLQVVDLDAEAEALLAAEGLGPDAVPAEGRFVRLRRAANVAAGGMPVAVHDQLHPDNRLLAQRAAAALRLDLAGIDLLIPDIARSWREIGGGICEINAQPSLGYLTAPHLYGQILEALLTGDGRIPIALVAGRAQARATADQLRRVLAVGGRCVGLVAGGEIQVGDQVVAASRGSLFDDGRVLLSDPSVEAAVMVVEDVAALAQGLPFDRFDLLVVAEEPAAAAPDGLERALADLLLPACRGRVLIGDGAAGIAERVRRLRHPGLAAVPGPALAGVAAASLSQGAAGAPA